jgi:hypothetical protein
LVTQIPQRALEEPPEASAIEESPEISAIEEPP